MIANLVCPIFEQPDRDTTWNQLDDVVDKLTSAGFVPVGPQRGRGAVRSRRACPSLRHVIGNVFEHQAHHLDPAIPLCNLVGAQRELASQGCAGPARTWSVRHHRRTLRACRLYDYDRHQWTDFDGRPTSPPLLRES